MHVAPSEDFTDFVFHALAHLELDGHGPREPEYLRAMPRVLPEAAWRAFREDATLLTAMYALAPSGRRVIRLSDQHRTVQSFLRSARTPIEALDSRHVDDPDALAEVQAVDCRFVDVLRTNLALCASAYERGYAAAVRPIVEGASAELADLLHEVATLDRECAGERVEIVWSLNRHAHTLRGRIVVGCPNDWSGVTPEARALDAWRASATRRAMLHIDGIDDDARATRAAWNAVGAVTRLLDASTGPLRSTHVQWLVGAGGDLLIERAHRTGVISTETASLLHADPDARVGQFTGEATA